MDKPKREGGGRIDPTYRNIDVWELLREAIMLQAVDDLRAAIAGRPDVAGKKLPASCSLGNLKRFFYGRWGQLLLGDIDGKWLYQELLKEGYAELHPRRGRGSAERSRA